jgi:hypothetical protein
MCPTKRVVQSVGDDSSTCFSFSAKTSWTDDRPRDIVRLEYKRGTGGEKMSRLNAVIFCALILALGASIKVLGAETTGKEVKATPNGITFFANYKDWRLLAISQREDNDTMRAILGNDAAISAARAGRTNPWPDGTVFAKLVWKNERHPSWNAALIPGKFVHIEFMVKDSKKYEKTGGWGFARWKGTNLMPYGQDEKFVMECFGCHTPVKDNDYVFTRPAVMP